jgi:hypothetical protein
VESEPGDRAAKKKRATALRVVGILCGLILITVGTLSAPRLGNLSMLFTLLGITVAVLTFVKASARGV